MKKTVLVIAVIILFFGAAAWFAARLLSPGSYVNAEEYELNASENVIINAVSRFKQNHPEYNLPIELNQADGRKDSSDYWYHIYFYYPKENQIVYVWLRARTKSQTTLALVSINEGKTFGNWKDINKDFSAKENKENKERFERRILDTIKSMIFQNAAP